MGEPVVMRFLCGKWRRHIFHKFIWWKSLCWKKSIPQSTHTHIREYHARQSIRVSHWSCACDSRVFVKTSFPTCNRMSWNGIISDKTIIIVRIRMEPSSKQKQLHAMDRIHENIFEWNDLACSTPHVLPLHCSVCKCTQSCSCNRNISSMEGISVRRQLHMAHMYLHTRSQHTDIIATTYI